MKSVQSPHCPPRPTLVEISGPVWLNVDQVVAIAPLSSANPDAPPWTVYLVGGLSFGLTEDDLQFLLAAFHHGA